MAEPSNKCFIGTFIHSKKLDELEYRHDTAVFVDSHGKIVAIEPLPSSSDQRAAAITAVYDHLQWRDSQTPIVQYECREGEFYFPGFIDTHLHAPQYPNVGIFGKSTLLDWLDTYTFPLEASLSDAAKARRVYTRVVRKTLSHGTTCAAYYATIDVPSTNLLADLCLGAGQRALIGRVCMDRVGICPEYYRDESPEASLAATRESIAHISRIDPLMEIVRPVITPRFAPSCTTTLMKGLGELARSTQLPVQTHVSENKNEIALVRELFPPALTGAVDDTYTAVYDVFGLLTDKTILAHGIHLSEGEVDIIVERKAKISHCPCSNSAITSGAARVRWLLGKGVCCGLGTDMSGGYSPSVLEAARQAALVSRHVAMGGDDRAKLSVEEVLYLATRGGAEVVGLEGKVGGFEVGMDWDAQLIGLSMVPENEEEGEGVEGEDGGNVDIFGWETWPDIVAKWLYNGDDRNTKKVWVKGRLVHERK
ncbi:Metallo-dependent hydrolase [Diplogelasinospora grovesii]|uniref:Guanine deaminase n=1 Tax=Diplogelasinospora grovesii TaxID=303347 RepID=A0AAN6N7X5_9PEZI|nr:Metallo-dependent hydrolase [Diplogelasinospora grovesii]